MPGISNLMTHTPADIVRKAMQDAGVTTSPAVELPWAGSAHTEPDFPDEAVTLYDQIGRAVSRDPHIGYARYWGVQVRVRSRQSNVGAQKAHAIRAFMEGWNGGTVTIAAVNGVPAASYRLHAFIQVGDVLGIGQEPQTGRELHTINTLVVVYQL